MCINSSLPPHTQTGDAIKAFKDKYPGALDTDNIRRQELVTVWDQNPTYYGTANAGKNKTVCPGAGKLNTWYESWWSCVRVCCVMCVPQATAHRTTFQPHNSYSGFCSHSHVRVCCLCASTSYAVSKLRHGLCTIPSCTHAHTLTLTLSLTLTLTALKDITAHRQRRLKFVPRANSVVKGPTRSRAASLAS